MDRVISSAVREGGLRSEGVWTGLAEKLLAPMQLDVANGWGVADLSRVVALSPNVFLSRRFAGMVRRLMGWMLLGMVASGLWAADGRPVVGPGATKDEVIDAYGWPTGQSQAGAKEILIYPQGRVVLDKGRVEMVDFSLNVPWPAPRPRPGTPGGGESWYTNWPEALKEAQRRHVRILILFVGSDWSPPSRQFLTEVAESTDFLTAFLGNFVLLKLDYPTRTTQMKALRTQNLELRERFEVTTYPALIITEPDGKLAARVDLNKSRPGDSYRVQVIAAVREARDVLPVLPGPATTGAGASATPATATNEPGAPAAAAGGNGDVGSAAAASMSSAGWALTWGLGGGTLLAVVLVWWLRRNRQVVSGEVSTTVSRVADAASGLPSVVEMAEWPHARLRAIVGVVAEADGFVVKERAGGAEGDLALMRRGEERASVIVLCAPTTTGPISAKRVRELFGVITIEEVRTGWYVAMAGFSAEAREYAQEHGLVLINRDAFREQLRALPERDLARAMLRGK